MKSFLKFAEIQTLFNNEATIIRAKGYSGLNERRDYVTAKQAVDRGWNSDVKARLSCAEANEWIQKDGWLGLVVPEGFIVVDIDDKSEGLVVREILVNARTKHHAIITPNGWQFIFEDTGNVLGQETKSLTLAGFITDFRLENKGYIILPIKGHTPGREWVDVCELGIDRMPEWLIPTGKKAADRRFSLPMREGERNDCLFKHGCLLQALGVPDEVIKRMLQFMADFVCSPSFDQEELSTTIRQVLKHEKGKKKAQKGQWTENFLPQSHDLDEWEEPIFFDEYELPEFPVALFPAWIRDQVEEFTARLQVPIDAACMAVLSVLSTALAKKYVVAILEHNWTEPINLYCATVMPPGEKKSETLRVFTLPLYRFQTRELERLKPLHDRQQAEREAKKKRMDHLDKKYGNSGDMKYLEEKIALNTELSAESLIFLPQFVTTDITPERLVGLMKENSERMAILSSEGGIFGTMAGRYSGGMANLDVFLMSYSGDQLTVDRQGRKEQLSEPALTFGLFIQPDILANLPEEMLGRGLLGRFLYALPQTKVGHRTLRAALPNNQVTEHYEINLERLMALTGKGEKLYLSQEAYSIFSTFWHRVELALRVDGELASSALQAWGNKLPGTILRVAGLVHVSAHSAIVDIPLVISEETMKLTVEAGEYFIAHARTVFGSFGLDRDTKDAKFLLNTIIRQDSDIFPVRIIHQLTKNHWKDTNELKKALSNLESRGYIRRQKDGRKEIIHVNPHLNTSKSAPNAPNWDGKKLELGVLGALIEGAENEISVVHNESEVVWI